MGVTLGQIPLLGEGESQLDEFSKVGSFDGKISEKVSNMYCSFSEIACLVVRASFF